MQPEYFFVSHTQTHTHTHIHTHTHTYTHTQTHARTHARLHTHGKAKYSLYLLLSFLSFTQKQTADEEEATTAVRRGHGEELV